MLIIIVLVNCTTIPWFIDDFFYFLFLFSACVLSSVGTGFLKYRDVYVSSSNLLLYMNTATGPNLCLSACVNNTQCCYVGVVANQVCYLQAESVASGNTTRWISATFADSYYRTCTWIGHKLYKRVCTSLCLCSCPSVCVCLSSPSYFLCLFVSVNVSVSVTVFVCLCLSVCLSARLSVYAHVILLAWR